MAKCESVAELVKTKSCTGCLNPWFLSSITSLFLFRFLTFSIVLVILGYFLMGSTLGPMVHSYWSPKMWLKVHVFRMSYRKCSYANAQNCRINDSRIFSWCTVHTLQCRWYIAWLAHRLLWGMKSSRYVLCPYFTLSMDVIKHPLTFGCNVASSVRLMLMTYLFTSVPKISIWTISEC